METDANGEPAVRGELLLVDPDTATLAAARGAGFAVTGSETLGSLGMSVTRLQVPRGMPLAEAQRALLRAAPNAENAPDNLHFQSGAVGLDATAQAPAGARAIAIPVGVIDGAPGKAEAIAATRGFAKGAPLASNHGSAVVSLLQGAGVRRVLAADVYGNDPAGGNALAIVRALDWLTGSGARVISISLVGPRNAMLEKAIGAVRRKGVVIVAAVERALPPQLSAPRERSAAAFAPRDQRQIGRPIGVRSLLPIAAGTFALPIEQSRRSPSCWTRSFHEAPPRLSTFRKSPSPS